MFYPTHLHISDCINVKIPQNVTYFYLTRPLFNINDVDIKYKLSQSIIHLTIDKSIITKIKLTQNITKLNLSNLWKLSNRKNKIIIPNNITNIIYGCMNEMKYPPLIEKFIDKKHNNSLSQKKSIKIPYLKINNNLIISLCSYSN